MTMMKKKEQNINLLRRAFREFYFNESCLEAPERIAEREFGYTQFGSGMVRHISFKDKNELKALLLKDVPSDVYCSSAYYTSPSSSPMEEKGLRGADLIFDIDIKELKLECVKRHEAWLCRECGNVLDEMQSCPRCKSARIEHVSLACDDCIAAGKREVRKLLSILREDLGAPEREISVYFSGNNGFHLHVYTKEFEALDSLARAEIADYVMGNSLLPESMGVRGDGKNSLSSVLRKFPDPDHPGWRGRAAGMLLGHGEAKPAVVRAILRNGYAQFKAELGRITKAAGAMIDPSVTTDLHRIFRLQGTLNSKSGLAKGRCDDLDSYDPFTSACLLGDEEVAVHVIYSPRFRLGQKFFGPFRDEDVGLPTHAAVYLICKGLAYA